MRGKTRSLINVNLPLGAVTPVVCVCVCVGCLFLSVCAYLRRLPGESKTAVTVSTFDLCRCLLPPSIFLSLRHTQHAGKHTPCLGFRVDASLCHKCIISGSENGTRCLIFNSLLLHTFCRCCDIIQCNAPYHMFCSL